MSSRTHLHRGRWRPCRAAAVRVVATAAVSSTLLIAAVAAPSDAVTVDRVDRALDEARSRLRATEQRRAVTVDRLADISRRRAALDAEVAQLDAQLSTARARLARHERQRARAVTGLVTLDRRATVLEAQDQTARARVRTSVQALTGLGRFGVVNAALGADTLGDAAQAAGYARAIAERQAASVRDLRRHKQTTRSVTDQLEAHRDQVAARAAAVAAERDRVAALVERTTQTRRRLAAHARRQRQTLQAIEADRDRHTELVADLEADSARVARQLRARAAAGAPPRDVRSGMARPADGPVTSPFGYRTHPISGVRRHHAGVDIGAPAAAPIRAARGGEVVTAGWLGGYGNAVIIDHGGGTSTLYAHQSSLTVATGDPVRRGQVVGAVGATGFVTGPHLHFEVRVGGVAADPMAYL